MDAYPKDLVASTSDTDQAALVGDSAAQRTVVRQTDGFASPRALGDLMPGDITVLCAEPGMGKTYIATQLMRAATKRGRRVLDYSFEGAPSDRAAQRLIRRCRDVRRRIEGDEGPQEDGAGPLVVFDGVPPGDEAQTESEASALRRLAAGGAQVLVCVRPEAEQLVEAVGECVCLRTDDLLFRHYDDDCLQMELTGGIPLLVNAARIDSELGDHPQRVGAQLMRATRSLLQNLVRPYIPDEECKLRLSMALLGSGTMEELALVAGRCDVEQLSWLERDVAVLGVDARNRSFRCRALFRSDVLEGCLDVLQAHVAGWPEIAVRACGVLASREEWRRSVLVSKLCASTDDHVFVNASWGVGYVGVGEARQVHDALRLGSSMGVDLGLRGTLSEAAALSMVGSAQEMDVVWRRLGGLRLATSMDQRLHDRVMMLGACREVFRNPRKISAFHSFGAGDALGMACAEHVRIARMLASGRFYEAYSTIANELVLQEPQLVPEAFLCDELLLSLSLAGGVPDVRGPIWASGQRSSSPGRASDESRATMRPWRLSPTC